MSWKVVLALGIVFAKPLFDATKEFGADQAYRNAYLRESDNCEVTTEELDKIAQKSEDDIRKFFEEKNMTAAQQKTALRYMDNQWHVASSRNALRKEIQNLKDWTAKMNSLREKV